MNKDEAWRQLCSAGAINPETEQSEKAFMTTMSASQLASYVSLRLSHRATTQPVFQGGNLQKPSNNWGHLATLAASAEGGARITDLTKTPATEKGTNMNTANYTAAKIAEMRATHREAQHLSVTLSDPVARAKAAGMAAEYSSLILSIEEQQADAELSRWMAKSPDFCAPKLGELPD